jgi:glycosyltransferase involved in cell wall biosynthesis
MGVRADAAAGSLSWGAQGLESLAGRRVVFGVLPLIRPLRVAIVPTVDDLPEGPRADEPRSVAVAIPCHNEAAAIAEVILAWRAALPDAAIVVFDNASTDGTGDLARALGVRVIHVKELGKGNAVRAAFDSLDDYDLMVMTDGDGTYPAEEVHRLLVPVLEGEADMVIGERRPVHELGAMTPVRRAGNFLIRSAFRALIGQNPGDMLSGYRVFSRSFRRLVKLRSAGFEIETELSCEAILHGLRVVEVPVPYRPRIEGTQSKLRAFRDGRRILWMILGESARDAPWRLAVALLIGLLATLVLAGGLATALGFGVRAS